MAECTLKIDIRRQKIMDSLRENGRVYVTELSKELNVTPVTIRNDLNALENDGYLERMSGGAILIEKRNNSLTASEKTSIDRYEDKQAIANRVSEMVKNGNTLFINSGSTAMLIAEKLKVHSNLNIVTNSLAVAEALYGADSFRVILLGGDVNTKYRFTYGADAEDKLSRYHADFAILSVDGISAESGITTYHAQEAVIDKMMIRAANRAIIAADATKIGKTGFMRIADSSSAITLVTNTNANASELLRLAESGVSLLKC